MWEMRETQSAPQLAHPQSGHQSKPVDYEWTPIWYHHAQQLVIEPLTHSRAMRLLLAKTMQNCRDGGVVRVDVKYVLLESKTCACR